MPYITTAEVKEKRNRIKKEFPEFRFSILCRHYLCIDISILSGPLDMKTEHAQINTFYIDEHYKQEPAIRKVLGRINNIADENNGVEVEDSDYGTVPNFYVHISIGQWDKPYKVIK